VRNQKITASQDEGFVVEAENNWLGVQNTERSKSHRLSG
jgi:hypothetical protein